jgi:hypothetical protein
VYIANGLAVVGDDGRVKVTYFNFNLLNMLVLCM